MKNWTRFLVLTLAALFLQLFTGCSKVWYWDKANTLANITDTRQNLQIQNLKGSDPIFDSTLAHFLFDNRLVSPPVGFSWPMGVEDQKLIHELDVKGIWGNTDLDPNVDLQAWGALYAARYNRNLLKLLGKDSLIVPLDERYRVLVKSVTGVQLE